MRGAINRNAKGYLNPPITNVSHKGILKTAAEALMEVSDKEKRAMELLALPV
ncbi:MAG TPA: hypothetical protein VJ385_20235 [Fibrobacteria bacterium]|nr:hypothetical protein [Fibrobacteria bacterium]